ncbi:MAG: AAA family ATPase, partial [Cetobacterium sp.]
MEKKLYPFMAIVGQEKMKEALILNIINPNLGGVLIKGEKGTAKSTAVRALAQLLKNYNMKVINLPISATEDRVVGTLDIEHAIKTGEKKFEKGILADADKNILYVDEINLLEDHIVDVLLDAAAMG